MSSVTVRDIGPVERVQIPVPEGGGLIVLRGRNGSGKTKTLEAVESLTAGRGKVDVRDGALKGSVEGFGATINVARTTRRSGELEVTTLEGRLSVADLVDPGFVDAGAADAARIKALVQLADVKADLSLFYPLMGSQEAFEQCVNASTISAADLVTMAMQVKRALDSHARTTEGQAETASAHAKALADATKGIDLEAVCDATQLQDAFRDAIQAESKIANDIAHAGNLRRAAAKAQTELKEAVESYKGRSSKDAAADLSADETKFSAAKDRCDRLRTELAAAVEDYTGLEIDVMRAKTALENAEMHERNIAGWQKTIDDGVAVKVPSQAEWDEAGEAVKTARAALEQGALVRKGRIDHAEAEQQKAIADSHAKLAEKLRDAAKGTDDVLSEVVSKSGCPLRVEAGRLVLTTKRGDTYFGDLSHGERWKMALDLAIDAVGEDGLLVIPQDAFESLDPINRKLIAEHVKGRGVVVLTAEASDDETLVAEEFVP